MVAAYMPCVLGAPVGAGPLIPVVWRAMVTPSYTMVPNGLQVSTEVGMTEFTPARGKQVSPTSLC